MTVERRTVTPAQVREQLRNRTSLAAGIWIDRDGSLHFSLPDLLALFGWADTRENRDEVTAILREIIARDAPDATIVEQDMES